MSRLVAAVDNPPVLRELVSRGQDPSERGVPVPRMLQLYGWKENFGDALNYWLWPKLFPGRTEGSDALLLGIGTVLSKDVPDTPGRKFVLGAGAGNDPLPRVTDEWTFLGVRGPRTAAKLSLPISTVITDSALLLRSSLSMLSKRKYAVSFMPHIISAYSEQWSDIANSLGLHYIDPRDSIDGIMLDIRESELLVTEAMHGAIVADAFRVPWIRVQSGERHAPTFKWLDWTESLGIEHESYSLPFLWRRDNSDRRSVRARVGRVFAKERLRWVRRVGRPRLSTGARSDEAYQRLLEQVGVLNQWLAKG